jgi:tetratricopeptide (TPR) repeat protein
MTTRIVWLCFVMGAPLGAQSLPGCQGSPAVEMNLGVGAYHQREYSIAAQHFRSAVDLDPGCVRARMFLGSSYMAQYVPGAALLDNLAFANLAREQFEKVLEQEPQNELAIASLASLSFNQKKLDDAKVWYKKLTVVNPENKEAFFTLGVIAWTGSFHPCAEARSRMGMRPDEPGPLKDAAVREALRAKYLPMVEEGIDDLEKALQIDPQFDDAMSYMNLLYRQKADLEASTGEYEVDIAKADEWLKQCLETRKAKAECKQ